MKRKLENTFLLTVILLTFSAFTTKNQKQTWYKGYQYNVNDDEFYPFKYTRKYSISDDGYFTTYHIYNPKSGRLVITIIAKHILSEKKIIVEVKNPNSKIFSSINGEETYYSQASLKPFGFRGSAAAFNNRIPNQLMVKFANNKFENIKVAHVCGTEAGSNNLLYYVLDED